MKVSKLILTFSVGISAWVGFSAYDAAAQTDAGGRTAGAASQTESTYRPRPKPRVKRVRPKAQKPADTDAVPPVSLLGLDAS